MNKWEEVLDNIHFTSSLEEVEQFIKENFATDYSLNQFIKDAEAFYLAYIDMLGYNSGLSLNKKLSIKFHKIARLLNLVGHQPDKIEEAAIESVFNYLKQESTPEAIKTAYAENSMDGPLQNHLVSLRSNSMPTSNTDFVGLLDSEEEEEEPKELNVKVSSLADALLFLSKPEPLLNLYQIDIKKVGSIKFNRDKMLCSINYK